MSKKGQPRVIAAPKVGGGGGKEISKALEGLLKASRTPPPRPQSIARATRASRSAPRGTAVIDNLRQYIADTGILGDDGGPVEPDDLRANQAEVQDARYFALPTPTEFPERPRSHEASYDPTSRTMTVRFRDPNFTKTGSDTNGAVYEYYEIPVQTWHALRNASSFGKTLNRLVIAKRYDYQRIAN